MEFRDSRLARAIVEILPHTHIRELTLLHNMSVTGACWNALETYLAQDDCRLEFFNLEGIDTLAQVITEGMRVRANL